MMEQVAEGAGLLKPHARIARLPVDSPQAVGPRLPLRKP